MYERGETRLIAGLALLAPVVFVIHVIEEARHIRFAKQAALRVATLFVRAEPDCVLDLAVVLVDSPNDPFELRIRLDDYRIADTEARHSVVLPRAG